MQTYDTLSSLRDTMAKQAAEDRGIPEWLKLLGLGALGVGGVHLFKTYQLRKAMQAIQKARKMKLLAGAGILGAGGAAAGAGALLNKDDEFQIGNLPGVSSFANTARERGLMNMINPPDSQKALPRETGLRGRTQKRWDISDKDVSDQVQRSRGNILRNWMGAQSEPPIVPETNRTTSDDAINRLARLLNINPNALRARAGQGALRRILPQSNAPDWATTPHQRAWFQ